MWAYRKLLKIPRTMKLSNNHIRPIDKMNSKRSLIYTIKNKKLKYFGHLIRHSKLHRMLLEGQANGRQAKGRPRMSYINNIKQWTGLSHIEAIRSAQDRLLWRTIASNPCAEDGTLWWWLSTIYNTYNWLFNDKVYDTGRYVKHKTRGHIWNICGN